MILYFCNILLLLLLLLFIQKKVIAKGEWRDIWGRLTFMVIPPPRINSWYLYCLCVFFSGDFKYWVCIFVCLFCFLLLLPKYICLLCHHKSSDWWDENGLSDPHAPDIYFFCFVLFCFDSEMCVGGEGE